MPEPPEDDGALSPEDLKRLGLAGRGDLSWVKRGFAGFPAFLRALRPTWRGVLLTVLTCWAIDWFSQELIWTLALVEHTDTGGIEVSSFLEAITEALVNRVELPHGYLRAPPLHLWDVGCGAITPLFAVVAAVLLFRSARGRPGVVLAAAAALAASVTSVAWILLFSSNPWVWGTYVAMLVPNVVILLAGTALAAWLLIRATGIGSRPAGFAASAPALVATALLVFNLQILTRPTILALRSLFHDLTALGPPGPPLKDIIKTVDEITHWWTTPILGALLLLVPALVVTRRIGFGAALRTLARFAVRRPAALIVAYVGLAVIALLPIRDVFVAATVAIGIYSGIPNPFPGSLITAFGSGLQIGLFIYATALVANALVDSLERDPPGV